MSAGVEATDATEEPVDLGEHAWGNNNWFPEPQDDEAAPGPSAFRSFASQSASTFVEDSGVAAGTPDGDTSVDNASTVVNSTQAPAPAAPAAPQASSSSAGSSGPGAVPGSY
jgi:hypothetical protein